MGTVSFFLPDPLPADAHRAADRACFAGGYDLAPVPTRTHLVAGRLTLSKVANESGPVLVGWPLPGVGPVVTATATLRERAEPYHLLVELVRGRVNQLRSRAAEWSGFGLSLSEGDRTELADMTRQFGRVALDPAGADVRPVAEDLLARGYRLADRMSRQLADLLFRTRKGDADRLPTKLGCRLTSRPNRADEARFLSTFSAARLVPDWAQIEPTESGYNWEPFEELLRWAEGAGLEVSVGPLIDLAGGSFPEWLRQWDGDLPSLAAFMCDFAETVVRRYQNRVRTWQVFAGFNHADAVGLGEDDRIRLAARLLEATRHTDPSAEWVIGVAQPWGDYMGSEDHTYSPLVFADTLMRAGFGFAAIDLELLCGEGGRASRPRDPLDTVRVLELFGVLGVPLEATVGSEPGAAPAEWSETTALVAAAMPHVRYVGWEVWDGRDAGRLPGAGLSAAQPDGLPARLAALRRDHLS